MGNNEKISKILNLKLLIILLFYNFNAFSNSGVRIYSEEKFDNQKTLNNILNIVFKEPESMLHDVDMYLFRKFKKLGKDFKDIFDFCDEYKKVDVIYNILKDKPWLSRIILDFYVKKHKDNSEGAKFFNLITPYIDYESLIFFSEKNLEIAFNIISYYSRLHQVYKSYNFDIRNVQKVYYLNYQEYKECKKFYSDNPIFDIIHNIKECINCDISRLEAPEIRKEVEYTIINEFNNNFKDKQKSLTITDFASGRLFQTFVILNRIIREGYKNIKLNLIDIEYDELLNIFKFGKDFDDTRVKLNTGCTKFDIKNIKHALGNYRPEFDALFHYCIYPELKNIFINNRFAYFLKWFNSLQVNLEVKVYKDTTDYINACKEDESLKSDFVMGIDYESNIIPVFKDLVKHSLKPDGKFVALVNYWLKYDNKPDEYKSELVIGSNNEHYIAKTFIPS